ncbi:hypothetical protein ACFVQ9_35395 [Streptomyces goshikiensis]|uniref:hypothetical protein n=1 Tax=Streptomyces goshikiensis TaxID=1942 RepID=UPI00367E5996
MLYADENSADELEAIHAQRLDVDLEMAEMNAAADAWHAVRDRGYCNHGSAAGHRSRPGQLICTAGCSTVFANDEDWYAQLDDPMANPVPLPGHPAHTPAAAAASQ